MLLPTGLTLRLRSTPDAEITAAALDVQHACKGREITLLEPAELRRPQPLPSSPEVRAVCSAWDEYRRRHATTTGMLSVPDLLLPLAQAIARLKAAA